MDQYDVAIIGGGLVGCASAYYLAKSGARVILLEQDRIGGQASGQNAGSLHFQLEHRLIEHGDRLAEQFALTIPLSCRAIEAWSGLEAELGQDLEVILHGGLMIAEDDAQIRLLEKKFALEQKWGLPTAMFDREQALAEAPYLTPNVRMAGFCRHEGHANPRLVTPAYARNAMEQGAEVLVQTTVSQLSPRRDGWLVRYDRRDGGGELRATAVLNAAGAWAADVAALVNVHLPIYPVPLTMTVTEATAPRVHHMIQHAGRRLSLKQVRDGNILIGGGWRSHFKRGPGGFDHRRSPDQSLDAILGNLAVACDVVPAIGDLAVIRSWTGTTGVTPDQLPLLGHLSAAPGFYVAAGGSAFTLGPVYAQLIAGMILGQPADMDLSIYGPDRFKHINMFMGAI